MSDDKLAAALHGASEAEVTALHDAANEAQLQRLRDQLAGTLDFEGNPPAQRVLEYLDSDMLEPPRADDLRDVLQELHEHARLLIEIDTMLDRDDPAMQLAGVRRLLGRAR